uniref:Uncharacterized protein n=1 Tax=Caenorhabditis tropicalis TaxID=1561998 RepID=A0A1I7UHZ7_9PELO
MDFDDLLDLNEDDNDEENERERRELIKRREQEAAAVKRARNDQRQAEEDRLYKQPRVVLPELAEVLNQKTVWLNSDEKIRYTCFIPQFVELFEKPPYAFAEKMKKLKSEKQLRLFIRNWFEDNDLGSNESEKQHVHDWLMEFGKKVVEALWEMTDIPKPDESVIQDVSNIFTDLKEKAVTAFYKTSSIQIFDKFSELREEEERIMMQETIDTLSALSINEAKNPFASREIQTMSHRIINSERDTSPVRYIISKDAEEELVNSFKNFFVDDNHPRVVEEEDPDLADLFTTIENDSPEDSFAEDLIHPQSSSNNLSKRDESNPNGAEENDSSASEDEDILILYSEPTKLPEIEKTESTTDYNYEEFMRNRLENRRQKTKRVKFADYHSSLNNMRLYIPPRIVSKQQDDDGPMTNYLDINLSEGYKLLHSRNLKKPLTEDTLHRCNESRQKRAHIITQVEPSEEFENWHGNILGRFWFPNVLISNNREISSETLDYMELNKHKILCENGYLRQYTPDDLKMLYTHQLKDIHSHLRRGTRRKKIGEKSYIPLKGVLIFTDWRLAHLDLRAITNACFQFMPTNIGDTFFRTMTDYIVKLCRDPNLDFHTIIFAFGGSPMFEKKSFLRFWEKLIFETTKSIEVFWTAQDWCDGLNCSSSDRDYLDTFNTYVKKVFDTMNKTGHRNYKWCNIREKYNIPQKDLQPPSEINSVNTNMLQDLLLSYVNFFVTECNCYCQRTYHFGHANFDDEHDQRFVWE